MSSVVTCSGCAASLCQSPKIGDCTLPLSNGKCRPDQLLCEHSCSRPSYLTLDVMMLFIPILVLTLVPPNPFTKLADKKRPWYVLIGIGIPLATSVVAFVFSTAWDNIIASKGVWTYDAKCMIGVLFSIPIEEYSWFILHTCMGQAVLFRLWSYTAPAGPRPAFHDRTADLWLVLPALALLLLAVSGVGAVTPTRRDRNTYGIC